MPNKTFADFFDFIRELPNVERDALKNALTKMDDKTRGGKMFPHGNISRMLNPKNGEKGLRLTGTSQTNWQNLFEDMVGEEYWNELPEPVKRIFTNSFYGLICFALVFQRRYEKGAPEYKYLVLRALLCELIQPTDEIAQMKKKEKKLRGNAYSDEHVEIKTNIYKMELAHWKKVMEDPDYQPIKTNQWEPSNKLGFLNWLRVDIFGIQQAEVMKPELVTEDVPNTTEGRGTPYRDRLLATPPVVVEQSGTNEVNAQVMVEIHRRKNEKNNNEDDSSSLPPYDDENDDGEGTWGERSERASPTRIHDVGTPTPIISASEEDEGTVIPPGPTMFLDFNQVNKDLIQAAMDTNKSIQEMFSGRGLNEEQKGLIQTMVTQAWCMGQLHQLVLSHGGVPATASLNFEHPVKVPVTPTKGKETPICIPPTDGKVSMA